MTGTSPAAAGRRETDNQVLDGLRGDIAIARIRRHRQSSWKDRRHGCHIPLSDGAERVRRDDFFRWLNSCSVLLDME